MVSEPTLTPRENPPLLENSPQRRIEHQTLHQAGQRAQHTTNELFRPPSHQRNVPWGRSCLDNSTCCHTEIKALDRTCNLCHSLLTAGQAVQPMTTQPLASVRAGRFCFLKGPTRRWTDRFCFLKGPTRRWTDRFCFLKGSPRRWTDRFCFLKGSPRRWTDRFCFLKGSPRRWTDRFCFLKGPTRRWTDRFCFLKGSPRRWTDRLCFLKGPAYGQTVSVF